MKCSEDVNILHFCIVLNMFDFLSLSEFNNHYWPTKLFKSWRWGHMTELQRQKMFLNIFFTAKCGNFSFEFCPFIFLYDLFTNKSRKLEVAESNLIMESFPGSFSLCRLGFLASPSRSRFISLSHSLSRYLSLSLMMPHFSCCCVPYCYHLLP